MSGKELPTQITEEAEKNRRCRAWMKRCMMDEPRLGVLDQVMKIALFALSLVAVVHARDDPVAPWTGNVRIAPVSAVADRHSIHSYCNVSDGPFSRLFSAEVAQ